MLYMIASRIDGITMVALLAVVAIAQGIAVHKERHHDPKRA
ncbi:MAG: hypothetical protein ACMV0F_02255 [Trichlorobacter sp.]